jgi:uncharacterized membrane protein YhhN
MTTRVVAFVAALASALAYIFAEEALGAMAVWVKVIPVAVLSGLVFRSGPQTERRIAAFGLAAAAVADAVIDFSFVPGLAAFLIAHLFYIAAFILVSSALRLWRLVPIAIWAALALPLLVNRAGSFGLPVLIYGVVIFIMIWRAAATVSTFGWNGGTIGLAGAVCFGISDTLLGYSRFVAVLPASNLLIMGSYWTAQTLIATSFLRPR